MKIKCAHCGKKVEKSTGHFNRAKKMGLKLFCSFKCFGLSRRKSIEEKKVAKAEYDRILRIVKADELKKQRHEYFKKDYAANPEKYRAIRKAKYQKHLQYLRQPKYKNYKHDHDKRYHAKKKYGKYWEAAIALHNLRGIVDNRKAKADQKSINKSQNRKRYASKNTKRKELESCSVGIYQPR